MIKEKSVKFLDNSEVRLTVTVPKEEVRLAYDDLVADYCKKANVPGFRRGRVPPAVMIRKFGDVLMEETQESLVRKSFDEAIEGLERKPLPYSTPYLVHDHGSPASAEARDHAGDHEPRSPAGAEAGEQDGDAGAQKPAAATPEPAASPEVASAAATETSAEAPRGTAAAAPEHEPERLSLDEDFTFTIAYDTYPVIELGEYRGIEVEKAEYEITDDDMDRELKALQEQNALVVDKKEGAVEKGNIVSISYVELDGDGAEKRGTKREGFSFEVGTGYNLYALDDDVVGLAVGEEKVIEKTFPADYQHKELAEKTVKVKVQVASIKEKNLPAIDDDLAQDINDKFSSLEDLKKDIRERLEETAKAAVRSRMVAKIMDTLYLGSKVPVPRAMINLQLASNWQTLLRQLRGDERAADRYLRSMGRTRDDMLEQWKPDAERRLKSSLIVVTVMEKEKIEATDDEVAARIKEIAERRGSSEEEVRSRIEQEDSMDELKSQIKERKLEELLLQLSVVKPGAKTPFLDLIRGNE